MCLSGNWNAFVRSYSKKFPNCVLVETHLHLIETILRKGQIMTELKFNCLSSKLFEDKSILRLSWNSISSQRNCSMTRPKCVWAKIQMHPIEIVQRQYRIVSQPKLSCLPSKLFEDKSILRHSRNSLSSHRSCSKFFPNCVPAERQWHLIEYILKQFQIVSYSESQCISSNLFYGKSKLCPSHNSFASHRKYSKTFPYSVSVEFE